MEKFNIILEDGSLFKGVFIKIGSVFAKNNVDVYWFMRSHQFVPVYRDETTFIGEVDIDKIYYFTPSKKY